MCTKKARTKPRNETSYIVCKTYTTFCGSFLLFTGNPFSHFSFFLLGNCVVTNFELAWVGRISHHGASGERGEGRGGSKQPRKIPSSPLSLSLLSLSLHLTPPSLFLSLPSLSPSIPILSSPPPCTYFTVFTHQPQYQKTFKWLFVSHPFRFIYISNHLQIVTSIHVEVYDDTFFFCYGHQDDFYYR